MVFNGRIQQKFDSGWERTGLHVILSISLLVMSNVTVIDRSTCERLAVVPSAYIFSHCLMDTDRKSTVSSFYGGRKSSMDALNQDFPPNHRPAERPGRDDASSFFTPELNRLGGRQASGGYNSSTFYPGREEPLKGGRDEEEEVWDVYADFNNAGPRYSTAFGSTTISSNG